MSTSKIVFFVLVGVVSSKAPSCDGSEAVCAARSGSAMLQTAAKKDDNLEGRAATLSAEIESLTNRVSIIMSTVGLAGAELLDKGKKPYEKYAALLHSKYDDAALKEVVTDLEGKATALKGNIKALENEVSGTQFDAALLATAIHKVGSAGDSLTSRMFALEEVVGSCRSRVQALEEKVSLGLAQTNKAKKSLLLQNDQKTAAASTSATKSEGAPLKGRLTTVEAEITSLQDRVTTMETEVMGGAAALMIEDDIYEDGAKKKSKYTSLLAKDASEKGSEDKADDLKARVATAEANVGTLKSKISTLQNQVLGGTPSSLLQTDQDGSSLRGRIISLEGAVDKMRTDVSSLEHTVVG